MPIWLTIVLALGGSAFISCLVNFLFSRTFYKKAQEKDKRVEEKAIKDMKDRDELEQFRRGKEQEALFAEIRAIVQPLDNKMTQINNKLTATSAGTLATLRNDILTCYYKCSEKGYRNDYDYQNIHDLYDAYVALDGNSFVADIMNRFENLPIKEEVKKAKKRQLNENKGEK